MFRRHSRIVAATGPLPSSHFLRHLACVLLLCALTTGTCFAVPGPISCDPQGGIWNFGLEWIADTCVPTDMSDSTMIHYKNNALVCDGNNLNVALYAPYGDDIASVADIAGFAASQGYKVFRNREGSHIVMVHPDYIGLINGKDMKAYTAGSVYVDIFKEGFILPPTPKCQKIPECTSCPCTDVPIGSTVNLNSGALSHNQDLFSLKGGQQPLSISLTYRSAPIPPSAIGNGWSHSYEQSLQILSNGSVTYRSDGKERDYRLFSGAFSSPAGDYSTLVKNSDGSYTLTEKDGLIRSFDPTGRIIRISDRNANSTSFVYNAGILASVTDPNGRSATFTYDENGKLATISDPMGNQYTFTYTGGSLSKIVAPDDGSWNYTYAANGLLAAKTDPGSNSTSYAYDSANRVTSSTDPLSQTRSVDYTSGGGGSRSPGKIPDPYPRCNNVGTTDPDKVIMGGSCEQISVPFSEKNGGVWKYEYEYTTNTLKSRTDPYNNKTSYTHDQNGHMLSKTEPGIGTTWYTYDTAGNVTSVKDPLGNITSYTYNGFGQVLTITAPQGNIDIAYDAKGNLTSTTDPARTTTIYEYDPKGNMTRITNAKGQATTLTYSNRNQVESIIDPAGIATTFNYDANGNMLTATGPGGTTTFTYDTMNRLAQISDPLGNITAFAYDKQGNLTALTDANGNTSTFKYNYQGQASEAKDALNNTTIFTYGATSCPSCNGGVDKLASLTDAKRQTTSYQYDLLSRLTQEIDPLNKKTAYSYDAAGNITAITDANGAIISYTYDALKRLTKKSYPDGSTESYSYDSAGRLATAINKEISYTFAYDTAGRMTKVSDNRGYALDYEYDILGMRTKMILQKGTPDERVTSYSYDSANRPNTITSSAGTFTYTYDNQGRRSSLVYPNGISATYSYDTLSRLTSIKHAAGATTIAFANYSVFDKVGNRKSKSTPQGTETYSYDAIYRLTQAATPKGNENYSYDPVGNRLTGPGPKDTKYQYNAGNQMTRGKLFGHDYDNNGNQITRTTTNADKSWTYTWDYENRLIKSEQTKGTEKRTVTFKYDPFGRRIEKKLTTVIKGVTKTATWTYVYDNDDITLEIYTNEIGATEKTFYTHGVGVDEHLALERSSSYFYYHADGLGSITSITNAGKNVVQTYEYDSFGAVKPSNAFRNSYTYTSREWDKEIGLYYYRSRYYDSVDGKFISKDPISFAGGDVNLYGYVKNNSINATDPDGLYRRDVHYYLTFHEAIMAGFSMSEAAVIARNNQLVDDRWATSPANYPSGTKLHFESRSVAEIGLLIAIKSRRLEDFGMALHIYQDTYSHAGYSWNTGHILDSALGKDPDIYDKNSYRDIKMRLMTLYYLKIFKEHLKGCK